MPGSTALQLYSYPLTTDQASPAGIQTLAQQVEKQVVAVFADAATRDSRWTAATGLANGAVCFITATGELQLRSGGAWVVIGGRAAPFASQAGTTSVTVTVGGGSGSTAVTFAAGRFSQAPIVTTNMPDISGAAAAFKPVATAITTTGMTVYFIAVTGSAGSTWTGTIHWRAVQMTSAAAAG